MMMSLFSVFDPSIYFLFSPWLMSLLIFLVFNFFWFSYNGFVLMFDFLSLGLMSEFQSVLRLNLKKGSLMMVYVGFFMIFFYNFFALYPSVFTVTGHILVSLGFSLTFWSSLIIFSVFNNFNSFLSHLVPLGTPAILMPFMVLVELVSNLIRPITLSVRLVANMVAGHLLMGLLGGFILSLGTLGVFTASSVGLVLTLLELAVSFIQGYVFLTLFSLYSEEIH